MAPVPETVIVYGGSSIAFDREVMKSIMGTAFLIFTVLVFGLIALICVRLAVRTMVAFIFKYVQVRVVQRKEAQYTDDNQPKPETVLRTTVYFGGFPRATLEEGNANPDHQ